MPDRAVVDDDARRTGLGGDYWDNEAEPQPRALCAISEDERFAVLPGPKTTVALGWAILEKQPVSLGLMATSWTWAEVDYAEDTGQSADEVLAAFLAQRPEVADGAPPHP